MTNFKGGYKLIDMHNTEMTVGGDGVTIAGVHECIEHNYRKRCVLTGINISGSEINDTYVDFVYSNNTFKGVLFTVPNADGGLNVTVISVTGDDLVTLTLITVAAQA